MKKGNAFRIAFLIIFVHLLFLVMSLKFHKLSSYNGFRLPKRFTYPFAYTPHRLCVEAATQVQAYVALQKEWLAELAFGKMFGVLVVRNKENEIGFLAAFSGQLAGSAEHEFFVPAVFDYLQPDGYFKTHEALISEVNHKIANIKKSQEKADAMKLLADVRQNAENEICNYQIFLKESKNRRDSLRASCGLSAEQDAELIRESQFQKAELKRLKQNWADRIAIAKTKLDSFENEIADLKTKREQMSYDLQHWLFKQFVFLNGNGEKADLLQIFESSTQPLPPSGAGECCAPKLLQFAFVHGYEPLCMAEFWWGDSPKQEVRHQGEFYPACKGKCEPILRFMLQGLSVDDSPVLARAVAPKKIDVVFEDEWYVVVLKPSGMLSVPGKIKADALMDYLVKSRPDLDAANLMVVHRLDMDTSGLLVVAKSLEAFKKLQVLFESRKVHKRYTALLDGRVPYPTQPLIHEFNGIPHPVGRIALPLCPDVTDRPRQMVNYEYGKEAVTFYEILGYEDGATRVSFFPQTGRTHQLRVHSAHAAGLNTPIVGDDLYGAPSKRLCLHAAEISFIHPFTNKLLNIVAEADF